MSKRTGFSQSNIDARSLSEQGEESIFISQAGITAEPVTEVLEQLDNRATQIPSTPKDTALLYFREEAKLMNERIKWYLEQQEKLETQGLFASGAIWAFILSRPLTSPLELLTLLPVILSCVLFGKSLLFTEASKESFSYLEKLETLSDLPEGMGWAHHFRLHGKKLKRRWRKAFWVLLILVNLATTVILRGQADKLPSWLRNIF